MIIKNTPWNPVGGSAAAISSIIEPQNVPEMNIHHQLCHQKSMHLDKPDIKLYRYRIKYQPTC